MLLILASVLLTAWIVTFLVLHVTGVAVHVLLGLAAVSALVHTIRPRHYRGAADKLPPDAIK